MVLSAASLLAGLFIVVFLGVYLAAEPEVYLAGVRHATPRRYRPTLEACAFSAVHILRSWLFAQMLSMIAVGTLVTLGRAGSSNPLMCASTSCDRYPFDELIGSLVDLGASPHQRLFCA
jgi:predicted PurR-regulated permease PerM